MKVESSRRRGQEYERSCTGDLNNLSTNNLSGVKIFAIFTGFDGTNEKEPQDLESNGYSPGHFAWHKEQVPSGR